MFVLYFIYSFQYRKRYQAVHNSMYGEELAIYMGFQYRKRYQAVHNSQDGA